MSRNVKMGENIDITRGTDHAVGYFVQVTDIRYSCSPQDEQGEGYVMDWDELFGFTINLIGASVEDLSSDKKLTELAETFAKKL